MPSRTRAPSQKHIKEWDNACKIPSAASWSLPVPRLTCQLHSGTKIHTCELDQYQQIPDRLGSVLWFSNLDFRRGQLEWPFPTCLWSPSSLNITNQFLWHFRALIMLSLPPRSTSLTCICICFLFFFQTVFLTCCMNVVPIKALLRWYEGSIKVLERRY